MATILSMLRHSLATALRQIKNSKLTINHQIAASLGSKPGQPVRESGQDDHIEKDAPVKYTTSKAHEHSPFDTFLHSKTKFPWYQPPIVLVSTVVFLIYFCILREENDIDDELSRSLFEKIPGLEEKSILGQINSAKELGKDTTALEQHLREVRKAAAAATVQK